MNDIIFWRRYIDDIFFITTLSKDRLLSMCNSISAHIQFTIEGEIGNKLNFLDMTVTLRPTVRTGLYIKPCHSGRITPWSSFVPRTQKINLLKGERHRLKNICSDDENLRNALYTLKDRFIDNGYPIHLITKYLFKDNVRTGRHFNRKVNDKNIVKIFLPFLGERFVDRAKRIISSSSFDAKITVIINNHSSIGRQLQPERSHLRCPSNCRFCSCAVKPGTCFSKFICYKITCSVCHATYIGETSRTMRSRLISHLSDGNSAVYRHLRSHNVNLAGSLPISWTILSSGVKHPNVRRSVEALHIRRHTNIMNGCVGRDLDF